MDQPYAPVPSEKGPGRAVSAPAAAMPPKTELNAVIEALSQRVARLEQSRLQ
jgi:hypothetical protein